MKQPLLTAALAVCAYAANAVAADQYQVTGPVTELTDTKIVVEKGKEKERHEFVRNPETKVDGELKVGAKVTVHYTMIANSVEVKGDKAAGVTPATTNEAKTAATPAPAKKAR